jgi:Fic family protein
MAEVASHPIWQQSTGIVYFEVDPNSMIASEIPGIKLVWNDQRARLAGTQQLSEFTDRLSREWAIETGIIENLYDIERGVTQTLIERGFQAELLSQGSTNRPREYVIQLLRDQKDALDGIFDFVSGTRDLSISYIKELHGALLRSQPQTDAVDSLGRTINVPLTRGDWKRLPNHPTRDGTLYTYCPPEQVSSEMERLIEMHRRHLHDGVSPEVEAAWLHHRFSQIHPFQDGNGRVARALASLLLIKEGLFPLVVTRDDKQVYLEALEAADRHDLKPLVALVAKLQRVQFAKATALSQAILSIDSDMRQLLGHLAETAARRAEEKQKILRKVFERADELVRDTEIRLKSLAPEIKSALYNLTSDGNVFVTNSSATTSYYFRAQIIENAKDHLRYFANTSEYRAWISLDVRWERRVKLVFAFHGIGHEFTGTLICAPFLEFRDLDDAEQLHSTLVPVADEGFLFFYNETPDVLLRRFGPWRENVLKVAIRELTENL